MTKKLSQRFQQLETQMGKVEDSLHVTPTERVHIHSGKYTTTGGDFVVNEYSLLNWIVKAKSLLSKACGEDSHHFKQFEKAETADRTIAMTGPKVFMNLKAIFLAAKEDFEGGYLSSVKALVQAEVFDSELEQARQLLDKTYYAAAAVISGVVLETALRELCDREEIGYSSLNKMNADLAKAGVYNKLIQKQITAYADVRNSAAHGKPDEYRKEDVSDMIDYVRLY